jgi:hypothetical protein
MLKLAHSSEEQLEAKAEETPLLVPIRIEFDTETHRVRDCFVWNTKGALVVVRLGRRPTASRNAHHAQ